MEFGQSEQEKPISYEEEYNKLSSKVRQFMQKAEVVFRKPKNESPLLLKLSKNFPNDTEINMYGEEATVKHDRTFESPSVFIHIIKAVPGETRDGKEVPKEITPFQPYYILQMVETDSKKKITIMTLEMRIVYNHNADSISSFEITLYGNVVRKIKGQVDPDTNTTELFFGSFPNDYFLATDGRDPRDIHGKDKSPRIIGNHHLQRAVESGKIHSIKERTLLIKDIPGQMPYEVHIQHTKDLQNINDTLDEIIHYLPTW